MADSNLHSRPEPLLTIRTSSDVEDPSLTLTRGVNSHTTQQIGHMSQPATEKAPYLVSCESCHTDQGEIWICNVCATNFCGQCWEQQIVHKKARGGVLHEKTNPEIAAKVQSVLAPPTNNMIRERLYRADATTAWFGMTLSNI